MDLPCSCHHIERRRSKATAASLMS
jgi:hypothetical protein